MPTAAVTVASGGDPNLQFLPRTFDCAQEAGGIASSEELLRVYSISSEATRFLRGGEVWVESSVFGAGSPVPASSGGSSSAIFHVDSHDDSFHHKCEFLQSFVTALADGSRCCRCLRQLPAKENTSDEEVQGTENGVSTDVLNVLFVLKSENHEEQSRKR
ncbi:hypothetical protein SAMN05443244_0973 [Terriglobus roseus]|uniref:Uncharacterized protein n=1 Tax=Terriglobus roseus TaxID=392734 RepID=A0A1H4K319_9BACT|nr:hypothetical protein SAMN05443244_0973 [Terriglobus roseus]